MAGESASPATEMPPTVPKKGSTAWRPPTCTMPATMAPTQGIQMSHLTRSARRPTRRPFTCEHEQAAGGDAGEGTYHDEVGRKVEDGQGESDEREVEVSSVPLGDGAVSGVKRYARFLLR